jgi:hypothetical protein
MNAGLRLGQAKLGYFLCAPTFAALLLTALSSGRLSFHRPLTIFALVLAPACTLLAIVILVRFAWMKKLPTLDLAVFAAAVLVTICVNLYLWWLIAGAL